MAEIELRNQSEYEFEDISSEERREYDFDGVHVVIDSPQYLAVSDNGHRVVDNNGKCHYIGYEGFYVNWTVKEDEPHFVK